MNWAYQVNEDDYNFYRAKKSKEGVGYELYDEPTSKLIDIYF